MRFLLQRTAAIFGLTALAVAQPLFSVLVNSPEFFVARNTTLGTTIALVLVVCLGVPLAIMIPELVLAGPSRRAAAVYHYLLLTLLVTAMVLPWLERASLVGAATQVAIASAAGGVAALAAARLAPARQLLALLAPAVIVVPLVFLLDPRIRDAVVPAGSTASASQIGRTPPVIFIVFDEFPLTSLLDEHREIDGGRYPNFAALRKQAYWFRSASGVSAQTEFAVPAIVSGRYPTMPNAVPTLRYYPNNLFTLLQGTYDMTVFGRFLQLCPSHVCHYDRAIPDDAVSALLADLSVVWLHIVLPEAYTQQLPAIVGDWRGFARARRRVNPDSREVQDRLAEVNRFIATIDARPARLYFLHSMLPHMPFTFVPTGRRYTAPDYQGRLEQGALLFERATTEYADSLYQRHLLQVGFVDRLLGRLFGRLRELGMFDEALIVITADHGASFRAGERRRELSKNNAADLMLVPLLIKVPGQTNDIVVDTNVSVVDVLPTVADVLAVPVSFHLEGRSLMRPLREERASKRYVLRNQRNISILDIADWTQQAGESLARKLRRFGTHDEAGLYTLPGTTGLLGQELAALPRAQGPAVRVDLLDAKRFANVDRTAEQLPLYVRGVIESSDPASLRFAIALNGIIAATAAPYRQQGEWLFATVVPERYLGAGRVDVQVFVVIESDGRFMLSETATP